MADNIPQEFAFWVAQSLADEFGDSAPISTAWIAAAQRSEDLKSAQALLHSLPEKIRESILINAKRMYRDHTMTIEEFVRKLSPPRERPVRGANYSVVPSTPQSLRGRYPLAAALVLHDCHFALEQISVEFLTGPQWRVLWLGAVSSFRAVWHVLTKVDAKDANHSESLRQAIASWSRALGAKKEASGNSPSGRGESIFFWLTGERDMYLKEYVSQVTQEFTMRHADCSTFRVGQPLSSVEAISFSINSGPFQGEDPRKIYAEAIEWFEKELALIRATANMPMKT